MALSRPEKLNHLHTILYEIDMVRFTAERLASKPWKSEPEKWLVLETFLLHFRNLVEFFGKEHPRDDDLTILRPEKLWEGRPMPAHGTLRQLRNLATPDLYNEFEAPNQPDKISRYLQHCTEQRVEYKEWHVAEMFRSLDDILTKFEQLLPRNEMERSWGTIVEKPVTFTDEGVVSTATVTKDQVFRPV